MNIIEIRDINDPALDIFSRLSETQLFHYNEPEPGFFLAESANVILRAMEAGYEPFSLLIEKERMETEGSPVFNYIKEHLGTEAMDSLPVYTAEREIVTRLTGYKLVRGLWAVMKRRVLPDADEFCRDKKRIALLYDVVNPTNVGAIIRSAAALGIEGALLTYPTVDPLTRRSARVSMGTVFQMPWTKLRKDEENGAALIKRLKGLGFVTAAMALTENSVSVNNRSLLSSERIAVILGTEGTGLPDEVIGEADYRVMIPMSHGVDSLNVAAASAVVFWELSNKA
ncbi:MAG: RNA methyltransferase [Lachnospiraceae bacterium]|nr:RNA methyltransferase [Lachnospiraceae bacterium]